MKTFQKCLGPTITLNSVRNVFYWGKTKRNFARKNSSKQNKISFRNFSIVTHLCYRPPSLNHGTMVNGRLVRSVRLACKACSSHGMSPTFRGLVSSA